MSFPNILSPPFTRTHFNLCYLAWSTLVTQPTHSQWVVSCFDDHKLLSVCGHGTVSRKNTSGNYSHWEQVCMLELIGRYPYSVYLQDNCWVSYELPKNVVLTIYSHTFRSLLPRSIHVQISATSSHPLTSILAPFSTLVTQLTIWTLADTMKYR